MKTVSIQELKLSLSALLKEASAGGRILITRHRRPVATLTPAAPAHVHVGRRAGRGRIDPLFRGRPGLRRYLEILLEDRRGGG